ncbi:Peroxidase [Araneus ventricosus]|uniref:Peroxidase n=1 Tax=Araneus ventricosus TaxID=182803 RepID=A0A4Y2DQX9_ARAVE|nr:Peroxidase [Araneus ventricosus]GBM19232.1 Peroxidase [Araneus ventricosus]
MKLWFSACIVIIGFSCFEADNRSSNQKCKTNVYAKKFREESSENEVDSDHFSFPDTDSGSAGTSDSDDEYYYQDCSIHDRMELGGSRNPNGFTDCQPSQPINCNPNYRYRTMNGSCNNLLYPLWGAANQCFRRYYPAHYTGFGNFRQSVTGASLPQPRQLSLNIFQNRHHPTEDLSFMFTIYGQTVAHDISLSDFESPAGDSERCCVPENENDSACINIQISADDPFYSQYGVTCLDMFRTVACTACNTTKRQQNTGQTAAMDASIVYGPDDNAARVLRVTDGTGRLRSNYTKKGEFLPSGNDPNDVFCPMLQKYPCFNAGDPRVNQHATLTSMQTVFMREHNRIAEELLELNPNWNDERLYQEARRITIAQLQYINYQEYLPHLLGQYYMSEFDLWVQRGSGGTRYNPFVEYGVWNEFSTVAFRLHSMTATDVGALNLQFRNLYSNPALLWQGHLGEILNGVCTVPSEMFDRWYVYDVTDFLFQRSGIPFGSDLASLDIQRGRDHGIAPYVYYVYYCSDGEVDIQSFDDLVYYRIISQDDAALLQQNYARVEDVDLYVGLQLEYHSRGAKVGPTTACIIARQFYHLKYGDRFYFEHIGEAGSFTTAQRASIKQTSLSRLLCDNTYISKVQLNSLLLPSQSNPQVWCNDIPRVDLSLWKES